MKKLTTLILMISLSLCALAQGGTTASKDDFVNFDLNGLCPGDKLTKAEVIEKFGQPLKYTAEQWPGTDDNGMTVTVTFEKYEYKDFHFYISSNDGLEYFFSTNPDIPVCTKDVNGGIKPGDKVEKVLQLPVWRWHESTALDNYTKKTGGCWYVFNQGEDYIDGCAVLVKDGIILGLEYHMITV